MEFALGFRMLIKSSYNSSYKSILPVSFQLSREGFLDVECQLFDHLGDLMCLLPCSFPFLAILAILSSTILVVTTSLPIPNCIFGERYFSPRFYHICHDIYPCFGRFLFFHRDCLRLSYCLSCLTSCFIP